jgi:coenzyme PQQ precursor peptide PqqA
LPAPLGFTLGVPLLGHACDRDNAGIRGRIEKGTIMAWTTPTLVEICIGLEINGYLPAEF